MAANVRGLQRLRGANPNTIEASVQSGIKIYVKKDDSGNFELTKSYMRPPRFAHSSYVDDNGKSQEYKTDPFYIHASDLDRVKDEAEKWGGGSGIYLEEVEKVFSGGKSKKKSSLRKIKRRASTKRRNSKH